METDAYQEHTYLITGVDQPKEAICAKCSTANVH
jgi:hypothetical protein